MSQIFADFFGFILRIYCKKVFSLQTAQRKGENFADFAFFSL